MPTSGRGGKRRGAPGVAYPNRTDMRQAPRAVPGQPYGEAGAQLRSQAQMPLATTAGVGQAMAPPPTGSPLPGELGPLTAPTNRPNEPLTAGLAAGPGPGPEIMAPPNPLIRFAAILNDLGDTADSDTASLRSIVNATIGNQGAA